MEKIPDVTFFMAGAGDMMPGMIEPVAQLRMGHHFHFTGFLKSEEVKQIYALSDLYERRLLNIHGYRQCRRSPEGCDALRGQLQPGESDARLSLSEDFSEGALRYPLFHPGDHDHSEPQRPKLYDLPRNRLYRDHEPRSATQGELHHRAERKRVRGEALQLQGGVAYRVLFLTGPEKNRILPLHSLIHRIHRVI